MRRLRAWLLLLALHTTAYAMTPEELIGALKRMGSKDAELLEAFPFDIEEERPDFLAGARSLRVTIRYAFHPALFRYAVAPDGKMYSLATPADVARMQTDLKLSIKDPEMAVRYAQWLLQSTEGPTLWLLSSVDDVPFRPTRVDQPKLAEEIEDARRTLARRISRPSARARDDGDGFVVTQEALHQEKLVRYDVAISPTGHTQIKREPLTPALPVVSVR